MKFLKMAVALEVFGLALGIIATVWFHRITMLLFFSLGLPAVALGILCYLTTVFRKLARSGAL